MYISVCVYYLYIYEPAELPALSLTGVHDDSEEGSSPQSPRAGLEGSDAMDYTTATPSELARYLLTTGTIHLYIERDLNI